MALSNYPKFAIISTTVLFSLSGCAQLNELKTIGQEPALEDVTVHMTKPAYEPVEWPEEDEDHVEEKRYSNSLWQPGSRAFFKDMKARRVGDILKVVIKIKDKAEWDNESERTRNNTENAAANRALGLENKLASVISGAAIPSRLLDIASSSNSKGTGAIAREEIIETEVAAMVTQILPNGNLVVHGDQEVRVNFELRKVTVDGIIRPEDIAADNSIDSKQIAEARISYGGRGHITNVQRPRIGTQIIDILSPF